jgi:hypothetical protein
VVTIPKAAGRAQELSHERAVEVLRTPPEDDDPCGPDGHDSD